MMSKNNFVSGVSNILRWASASSGESMVSLHEPGTSRNGERDEYIIKRRRRKGRMKRGNSSNPKGEDDSFANLCPLPQTRGV